ncbi:hypothetical protein FE275_14295 [Pseudomonas koreensis]|nr:hypothetical protein FE275_14295 [Pseudomonas koreensis]
MTPSRASPLPQLIAFFPEETRSNCGSGLAREGAFENNTAIRPYLKNGTSPNTVARCITRRAGR